MVSVEKSVIAKITRNGIHFEILVDPDMALEYKKGKAVPIDDLLAANEIFTDSHKGERASDEDMQKNFGTTNHEEIAKKILKDGEIQLTTEQRRKIMEERRLQVADIIAKNGADPKTHLPHPQQRILNAIGRIDTFFVA